MAIPTPADTAAHRRADVKRLQRLKKKMAHVDAQQALLDHHRSVIAKETEEIKAYWGMNDGS